MTRQDYFSLKEDIQNLGYVASCVNNLQSVIRTYDFLKDYTLKDAAEWLADRYAQKEIELQEKLGVVGDDERTVRVVSPELLKQWDEIFGKMDAIIELK